LFLPAVEEIYPTGLQNSTHYQLGFLETVLEGKFRPGHFQGVCMVVNRLMEIIQPDYLYLGQKDYQQCMVINRLLQLIGSNTKLVICETTREQNGLAMSSRNIRLNDADKQKATAIFNTLNYIKNKIKPGNITALKQNAIQQLTVHGFKVDYIEIADSSNLEAIEVWDGKLPLVILAAAFLSEVRLIDNILI
jgi:pantoate--beta-alanine ligase